MHPSNISQSDLGPQATTNTTPTQPLAPQTRARTAFSAPNKSIADISSVAAVNVEPSFPLSAPRIHTMAAFHAPPQYFFAGNGSIVPGHFAVNDHLFAQNLFVAPFPSTFAPGLHANRFSGAIPFGNLAMNGMIANQNNLPFGKQHEVMCSPNAGAEQSGFFSERSLAGLAHPGHALAHPNTAQKQEMSHPREDHHDDPLHPLVSPSTKSDGIKMCAVAAGASKVFPRRKNGQVRRELSKPVVLTEEVLRQYFNTPLRKTAKELGICATALKKVCRNLGIQKWPYRSLSSQRAQNGAADDADSSDHSSSPPPSEPIEPISSSSAPSSSSSAGSVPTPSDPSLLSALSTASNSPRHPALLDVESRPSQRGPSSSSPAGPPAGASASGAGGSTSLAAAALLCELQASVGPRRSAFTPPAPKPGLPALALALAAPTECSDNSIDRLLN